MKIIYITSICILAFLNSFSQIEFIQDLSFGKQGKVITSVGKTDEGVFALAVQPDGKIVAGGRYWNGKDGDFVIIRYLENGDIDKSFGDEGFVKTHVSNGDEGIYALVILKNGKILATGITLINSDCQINTVRFNSDGSIDHTFGNSGFVTAEFEKQTCTIHKMTTDADENIIIKAYAKTKTKTNFFSICYTPDGFADNNNGINGIQNLLSETEDDKMISDISVNANSLFSKSFVKKTSHGFLQKSNSSAILFFKNIFNDKIFVAGRLWNGKKSVFAIAQFNSDGTIDDFSEGNAIFAATEGDFDEGAFAIATQPDGKIIVAGTAKNGQNYDFALTRFSVASTSESIERNKLQNVTLYPNPTKNKLNIHSHSEMQNAEIQIFNSNGQNIYRRNNIHGFDVQIDTQEFSNGSYIITIQQDKSKTTQSFIIEK